MFLAERVSLHNRLRSTMEHQLEGQRWVRAEEQRTAEGGTIHVRVDITDLKNREASFRLLFEHNPVPMFVWAQESRRFLAPGFSAFVEWSTFLLSGMKFFAGPSAPSASAALTISARAPGSVITKL